MTPTRASRLIALLFGLVLTLGATTAYLLVERRSPQSATTDPPDEEVRRQAVERLMARSAGIWDSYADADVGRILQLNVEAAVEGVAIRSNAFGMREAPYARRKPSGTLRVVLLGDSYVYGTGGRAEDRFGTLLAELLEQGRRDEARGQARIEVLHVGLESWNILAECQYLRRQLSDLQPDLVIHLTVENDLEDVAGVRGFGEMARFSPQARTRGDGRVGSRVPPAFSDRPLAHYLAAGLDWESRSRYERAEQAIDRLVQALRRRGTKYLHLFQWNEWNGTARDHLAHSLEADEVAFLSRAFHFDEAHWVGETDRHWNRLGNERIAHLLYGLIEARELLSDLRLEPSEQAAEAVATIHGLALGELRRRPPMDRVRPYLTCPPEDKGMARQLYVGLDRDGSASAYVSFVLALAGGDELVLEGASLGRDELAGGRAAVFVDEVEVGTLALGPDAPFPYTFTLPAAVAAREYAAVRIESDDWIYEDLSSGKTACFVLHAARVR